MQAPSRFIIGCFTMSSRRTGGYVFKTVGDASYAAFDSASAALEAAT
jgi:class 3 adenylate cyclase